MAVDWGKVVKSFTLGVRKARLLLETFDTRTRYQFWTAGKDCPVVLSIESGPVSIRMMMSLGQFDALGAAHHDMESNEGFGKELTTGIRLVAGQQFGDS